MNWRCVVAVAVAVLPLLVGTARADEDPSIQCGRDLAAESRFDAIRAKIPMPDIRNISFEMLANDAIPTPPERRAIAAWFAGQDDCKERGSSWRESHYPAEVNSTAMAFFTQWQLLGIQLVKGKIAYSDANKRLAVMRDDYVAKLTEIMKQYKQELEAQQAQEARQAQAAADKRAQTQRERDRETQRLSQAAAEADARAEEQRLRRQQMILNYMQSNRYVLPMPRQPTQTNCTTVGNQTTCTSQ
jgi:hypothetical protein